MQTRKRPGDPQALEKFIELDDDLTPNDSIVVNDTVFNTDTDLAYDVIQLPSNGEPYRNKVDRVSVAYLTAYDENIIMSPNL